jgi:hypothetical protein
MNNIKYHTVEIAPKSNSKIVERGKNDRPSTKMYDCELSGLGTDTEIKYGGVKLVL